MKSNSMPKCPKCIDGGVVRVSEMPNEDSSIFKPLPKGQPETIKVYKCVCGWTQKEIPQPANADPADVLG